MKTKQSSEQPRSSRRRFLRGGAGGAALFGLGSLLGWFGPRGGGRAVAAAKTRGRTLGKEYDYDLSKYRTTDPKLLLYEETAPLAAGLKEVRAVAAASEGACFVAGDRAVRKLDATGRLIWELALSEAPRCLALAPDGEALIGFKGHVEVCAGPGPAKTLFRVSSGQPVLTSLGVSGAELFVADAGNRVVWHYDRSGKVLGEIGRKNPARGVMGFVVPSPFFDLAVGSDGLLWVANPGQHRLEAYTFAGALEASWGKSSVGVDGFCGCCNPVHFAFLPDGRVVTSEKGLMRVKVYSATGDFLGVVAGPESFPKYLDNPNAMQLGLDVAIDAAGRVLLADPLNSQVRVFRPSKTKAKPA